MRRYLFIAAFAGLMALPALAQGPEAEVLGTWEKTNTGQPIEAPEGPLSVTVSRVTIPAGGQLPVHKHPYQRIAYVESGVIDVTNIDTGAVTSYRTGGVIIEARGQWHTGRASADGPVVLLVIDQTPPGKANMERREEG